MKKHIIALGVGIAVIIGIMFFTNPGKQVGMAVTEKSCTASSTTWAVGAGAAGTKTVLPANGRRCGWMLTPITNGATYNIGATALSGAGHWLAASSTVVFDTIYSGSAVSVAGALLTASSSVVVTEFLY